MNIPVGKGLGLAAGSVDGAALGTFDGCNVGFNVGTVEG